VRLTYILFYQIHRIDSVQCIITAHDKAEEVSYIHTYTRKNAAQILDLELARIVAFRLQIGRRDVIVIYGHDAISML